MELPSVGRKSWFALALVAVVLILHHDLRNQVLQEVWYQHFTCAVAVDEFDDEFRRTNHFDGCSVNVKDHTFGPCRKRWPYLFEQRKLRSRIDAIVKGDDVIEDPLALANDMIDRCALFFLPHEWPYYRNHWAETVPSDVRMDCEEQALVLMAAWIAKERQTVSQLLDGSNGFAAAVRYVNVLLARLLPPVNLASDPGERVHMYYPLRDDLSFARLLRGSTNELGVAIIGSYILEGLVPYLAIGTQDPRGHNDPENVFLLVGKQKPTWFTRVVGVDLAAVAVIDPLANTCPWMQRHMSIPGIPMREHTKQILPEDARGVQRWNASDPRMTFVHFRVARYGHIRGFADGICHQPPHRSNLASHLRRKPLPISVDRMDLGFLKKYLAIRARLLFGGVGNDVSATLTADEWLSFVTEVCDVLRSDHKEALFALGVDEDSVSICNAARILSRAQQAKPEC